MWRATGILLWLTLPALAEAPEASIFPQARPATVAVADPVVEAAPIAEEAVDAATQAALDAVGEAEIEAVAAQQAVVDSGLTASPFPRARPAIEAAAEAAQETARETAAATPETPAPETAAEEPRGLLASLFGTPRPRPERIADDATAAPRGNGICGNPALTGVALDRIRSRTTGCGVDAPVQITAVDGVRLSLAATMDCTTANALARWVDEGLRPAFDQPVVGLQVAGHYICRTRNHVRGARISEHGRGKAIDISGVVLADGTVLTVAANWNRAMRAAYQAGCGIFGTTLGPGSDGYHEDHMHFDTASHRNGAYCR